MNYYSKRNGKGFTLIELVVVIAILGVLAVIAIPRYAGFTDKAKNANDTQYVSLIAHAATALVADGTFTSGGTIEIANDGSVTSTGTHITGFTDTAIYNLVPQHPLEISGRTYVITLDVDGTYEISIP